jgi:ribosomal protein S18 acetylase RimI-like enzyme
MKRTAVIDRRYSGLRIVEAGPADVESILPLFLDYLEFYRRARRPATARKFLRDRLTRRESKIFLALLEGEPVGFVQLYPTFASLAMKRSWVLYDLFVVPAARKRGVAKALMERARQLAVETGAEGLILETAVDNRPAQRLYESLGWRRDSEFYRYFLKV